MPVSRETPLKQNIRVWFDYLKVALNTKTLTIKQKDINVVVNKEYYRSWDLPQVRKLSFDKWWKTHSHLFAHKEFVNVRVLNELSLNDAMKDLDKSVLVEYLSKGNYEAQIKFSGDTLLFHMHSNVFDFPKNHSINQTKYVKDDNLRSFCGVIHIYNVLSDSLKYNRLNDEGLSERSRF